MPSFTRVPSLVALAIVIGALPARQVGAVVARSEVKTAGATISVVEDIPASPRAILILAPFVEERQVAVDGPGGPSFRYGDVPLIRDRGALTGAGIGVVSLGPAYVGDKLDVDGRTPRRHANDLNVAAESFRQRFPTAKLVLAGIGRGTNWVLQWLTDDNAANGVNRYDAALLVSGYYADWRSMAARMARIPVLMAQSATASCRSGSIIEAGEAAAKLGARSIWFYDARWDTSLKCALAGTSGLAGHDEALRQAISIWLDGREPPATVGDPGVGHTWRERLIAIQLPETFGSARMETTLFLPDPRSAGPGPYPLMVFHHGDVLPGTAPVTNQRRIDAIMVAREFLRLGYAVGVPERPGVGRSDGAYQRRFNSAIDTTEKGRFHGAFALYATEALLTLPEVDRQRVVLSGQSAGGYAVLAVDAVNPPWLKAVVNFSGGLSDVPVGEISHHFNRSMVDGFREFGKTARVPVAMVFTENDSRYAAQTIRYAMEAWIDAGAPGELHLYPAITGDNGHFVYNHPDIWRVDVLNFLAARGLPAAPLEDASREATLKPRTQ